MKNRFTAFVLILIALVSTVCDNSADTEEPTAEVVDMNISAASETEAVPEMSEADVKSEAITEETEAETTVSETVTEAPETEPEVEGSENM